MGTAAEARGDQVLRNSLFSLFFSLAACVAVPVIAQEIINPDQSNFAQFGIDTAVFGDFAVVGSSKSATYIYNITTGAIAHTLDPPSRGTYGGRGVAISGSTAVLGNSKAFDSGTNAGNAYLYDIGSGDLMHTLSNPEASNQDSFGDSVAISGNTAVVGALFGDRQATGGGAAYVYDVAAGSLLLALDSPTPQNSDKFGFSVAVSGNIAAVGSPGDGTTADNSGSVYVYNVSTGALLHTLTNPNPAVYDQFGYSVAMSGDNIIVSSQPEFLDLGDSISGSAYVYSADTGSLIWTLQNPFPELNDYFGMRVAISSNTALVGAGGRETTDGTVYVYDLSTGALSETISNPDPGFNEGFGYEVAISESGILVSSPDETLSGTPGQQAGAIYLFDSLGAAYLDGSPGGGSGGSASSVPEVSATGSLAAFATLFALMALLWERRRRPIVTMC